MTWTMVWTVTFSCSCNPCVSWATSEIGPNLPWSSRENLQDSWLAPVANISKAPLPVWIGMMTFIGSESISSTKLSIWPFSSREKVIRPCVLARMRTPSLPPSSHRYMSKRSCPDGKRKWLDSELATSNTVTPCLVPMYTNPWRSSENRVWASLWRILGVVPWWTEVTISLDEPNGTDLTPAVTQFPSSRYTLYSSRLLNASPSSIVAPDVSGEMIPSRFTSQPSRSLSRIASLLLRGSSWKYTSQPSSIPSPFCVCPSAWLPTHR